MIIKYLEGGTWNYIDHVHKAENSAILPYELCKQYDDTVNTTPDSIIPDSSNKAFQMVQKEIIKQGYDLIFNLLENDFIDTEGVYSAVIIKAHIEKNKGVGEYTEVIALVTNQTAYLLNDNGKTIERLN